MESVLVRIRMQRLGRTHRPFYRINAVDIRVKRNGKVIENLGWYNPVERDESKQVLLKTDRILEWLGKGAQPSETVLDLLGKAELLEGKLKNEWITSREILRQRGKCKAAVKAIEAAIADVEQLVEDSDADADALTAQLNICKREMNNAKRTLSLAQVEPAEAAASTAAAAVAEAKKLDEQAKAASAAEAESAPEGDPEGESSEG